MQSPLRHDVFSNAKYIIAQFIQLSSLQIAPLTDPPPRGIIKWTVNSGKLKVESGKFMGSVLEQKSFQFAIRTVNLCKHLRNTKKEYTLSKQLLHSGTSIGANIAEAQQAQSKADFISKLSIALKETTETKYWLRLMSATGYLSEQEYQSIFSDCVELEKMLVASVKTSKDK